jgi:hypothetical protein
MHIGPATGQSPRLHPVLCERRIRAPLVAACPRRLCQDLLPTSPVPPSLSPYSIVARLPYLSRQRARLQVFHLAPMASQTTLMTICLTPATGAPIPTPKLPPPPPFLPPSGEKLFHVLYSSINGGLTSSSHSSCRRTPLPQPLITGELSPTWNTAATEPIHCLHAIAPLG